MNTIKEAVIEIKKTIVENFGEDIQDIILEEIETNYIANTYELTISYLVRNKNVSNIDSDMNAISSPFIRQYKDVKINFANLKIDFIKNHKNE